MNRSCLLLFVLSTVALLVYCDENQLKNNARRNKYQKSQQAILLPVNGSQSTASAAIFPLQTATNAEALSTSAIVKSSETNKTSNTNDIYDEPKFFVNNINNPDENLISNNNATETSRKSSRPLRNNQALFEALKKRRKEAYQRKIIKKSQITNKKDVSDVNFENQSQANGNKNNTTDIVPENDSSQSQKPTKKSSTYRNKSKNFGHDSHGFNKSKTRRFSVKV